jgi:tRNA (cytidine32/uridine32-2'-O)-methyltransferase
MTTGPVDIAVAVVDAETPGNVGTIARAMKNFGLSDLLLVDPPELDPDGEAYGFAGRAREDILPNATEISFESLVENYDTIGCTATTNESPENHVRYPALTAADLPDHLDGIESDVAIVFGRERVGLTNDELARIDAVCSIPASAEYPSLNLGQAATVVLYELRSLTLGETQHPDELHERADAVEIERLHDQFEAYIDAIGHPDPKRDKARRLFRRLLGRAHPTPREVWTLQGLLRRGEQLSRTAPDDGQTDEEGQAVLSDAEDASDTGVDEDG